MQIYTTVRWLSLFFITTLIFIPPTQAKPQAPPLKENPASAKKISTVVNYDKSNQPIAIYSASTESSDHIQSSVTAGEVSAGQLMTITTIGALGQTNEDVQLTIDFPNSEQIIVDEYSIELTEVLSSTTMSLFESSTNTFTWSGRQTDGAGILEFVDDVDFAYAKVGFDDLVGVLSPYTECRSGCDEKRIEIDISGFGFWEYEGQNQTLFQFWENGLIQIGESDVSSTWKLQELPSATTPNGIIAPFWSDFEVMSGVGELRYNLFDDGSDKWLIFEWYKVQEWGDTTDSTYTFNVWFRLGSSEVYINYLDVDTAGVLSYGAIGLESSNGETGQMLFYNGVGEFPVNGSTLSAQSSGRQAASTQVDINVTIPTFGSVGSFAVEGIHGQSISANLIDAIGSPVRELTTLLNISSGAVSYDAELLLLIQPDGDLSVEVTAQPEHGSVSLDGMTATYTPDAGYIGADSFSYRVVDAAGATSTENTVSMTVTNSAPTVTATAPESAENGDTVVLDASSAADADGDALTYSWTQTAGPDLELSGADTAQASFTAPLFEEDDTDFGFAVTVSDGFESVTSDVVVTVLADPNTAPVINISAPSSVSADTIVRLDASGTTDAEDDTLTFNWQFAGGTTVSLNNANTAVATFTAPRVFEQAQANFMVTVSDGRATSQQMVTVTIEAEKKSSGSMPWLFIFMALPLLWLRRRKG